jgi:hypothetical protein
MKRLYVVGVILAGTMLLLPNVVLAVQQQPIEVTNLFDWATSDPPDWARGGLYAALGLVGALVTVFGLIGGAVPGTAGSAKIIAGLKRVEEREKVLDGLIKDSAVRNPEEIRAVELAANNLRDDVRDARRRQFILAASLYAILGAFFAALLAGDLLQALLVGAGWTAYLGALGLKSEYSERKSLKDEGIEKFEGLVQTALERPLVDHEIQEGRIFVSEAGVLKAL